MGKGCEAVFKLNGPHGLPELRENYGFAARELTMIAAEIDAQLPHLKSEWSKFHGR
jgi:hypothetical protein